MIFTTGWFHKLAPRLVTQTGCNDRFITAGSCYQPVVITAQIFTNGS
jgi:hypothetical protein